MLMRRLACLLAIGFALSARAVIVSGGDGTQNQTSAGAGSGWNYVGSVNGASGVYLGNYSGAYWVLTAGHVGGHPFTLDGVTYQPVGTDITLTNSDGSSADLKLFRIDGDASLDSLANLSLSSATPLGQTVTLVGNGIAREASATHWDSSWQEVSSRGVYTGYKWTNSGVKSWGANTVQGSYLADYGNGVSTQTFYTQFRSGGVGQATTGDSGGGVFASAGELAGIMIAVTSPASTGQPASTSILNFNDTYIADVSAYRSEILSYLSVAPVSEPTAVTLLGLCALVMLARIGLKKARAGLR